MGGDRIGLYGREPELDRLTALLDGAAHDQPFVAVIEGEAGIGKSRLLAEATKETGSLDVVRARAYELERHRPFGPLIDALELHPTSRDPARAAIADRLRRNRGEIGSLGGDPSLLYEVVDAIVDVLETRSEQTPVLLTIEDVHWADRGTLMTLGRLARLQAHMPTSIIATARPTPRSVDLSNLVEIFDGEGGTRLDLAPLGEDAVTAIAAEMLGARPTQNLVARLAGASGNPLYVVEVVAALDEDHAIVRSDGAADVERSDLPPSLRLTILRRLSFLPQGTVELLRLAAVLGATFPLDELATVTNRRPSDLLADAQPALDAGVLVRVGDTLSFRHDLIHDAAYNDLPETTRSERHHEFARALAAANAPALRVSPHFERASTGIDAEASEWMFMAAGELGPTDGPAAVDLTARALERTPPDHPRYDYERTMFVSIRLLLVPGEEIEQEAVAAIGSLSADELRWRLELNLISRYAKTLRFAEAEQLAFARRRSVQAQCVAAAHVGIGYTMMGDLAGAERVLDEVAAHAIHDDRLDAAFMQVWNNSLPDLPVGELARSSARAYLDWLRGRTRAALAPARRASEIVEPIPARARELADAAIVLVCSEAGDDYWRGRANKDWAWAANLAAENDAANGMARWLWGEWDAALTSFDIVATSSANAGPTWADYWAHGLAASIAFHRDDLTTAKRWLDSNAVSPHAPICEWTRGLILEAQGQLPDAFATLHRAWQRETRRGYGVWQRCYAPDLVRLTLEVGDEDALTEIIRRVDELAELGDTDGARGTAARCHGLIDADADQLLEAAALFRGSHRPVEAAYAQEDAAALLAANGDTAQARELLDAAIAEYERVGAVRDVNRAVRRLRDHGIQRRTTPAVARPTSGWASLTDAETRVVELVAAGHTYREIGERLFISRRTVETHVAHVFTKLDLKSKIELATAYASLPEP